MTCFLNRMTCSPNRARQFPNRAAYYLILRSFPTLPLKSPDIRVDGLFVAAHERIAPCPPRSPARARLICAAVVATPPQPESSPVLQPLPRGAIKYTEPAVTGSGGPPRHNPTRS